MAKDIATNHAKITFDIMLLLDDGYVHYSLPFLKSLRVNNNNWATITLHVITNKLSQLNR